MNKVTIIGSINLDRTLRMEHLPQPGETIHASEVFTAGGGKGANQAIAAKRSEAETYFIGAVGNDEAGKMMLELLSEEKIDVSGVTTLDNQRTGTAFIMLDSLGENSIIIHSGANNSISISQVEQYSQLIENSDFLISQFETDLESTMKAFEVAKLKGVRNLLNPAPAFENVPKELLEFTDMIVPNESEVEILTGIKISTEESMIQAANYFHQLGIEAVVITLGSQGSFYDVAGERGIVPALKVNAVDTTAAGDTFIGAMSTVLKRDFSNIKEAITYGTKASSLTVQRFGAQPSIPYKTEI